MWVPNGLCDADEVAGRRRVGPLTAGGGDSFMRAVTGTGDPSTMRACGIGEPAASGIGEVEPNETIVVTEGLGIDKAGGFIVFTGGKEGDINDGVEDAASCSVA